MGKRIVSQARGHGSSVYRVRRKGYMIRIGYPNADGNAKIIKLVHSPAHSAPLIKVQTGKDRKIFYNLAFENAFEGQEIVLGKREGKKVVEGDIMKLKDIPQGTRIYNIETTFGDGGKLIRSGGSFATVNKREKEDVIIFMPSKKEKKLNGECRATIGTIAGSGRKNKPILKAGRRFHIMKAKGRKWHYTSAIKVNAVDHPFGSGRGKRIKSKIAKRNAPPGRRVGHLRPRRTGKKR